MTAMLSCHVQDISSNAPLVSRLGINDILRDVRLWPHEFECDVSIVLNTMVPAPCMFWWAGPDAGVSLIIGLSEAVCHLHINEHVNSLWPSDTLWWHKSGSTLTQIMTCCMKAPSHCLNQRWLIISEMLFRSLRTISREMLKMSIFGMILDIDNLRLQHCFWWCQ